MSEGLQRTVFTVSWLAISWGVAHAFDLPFIVAAFLVGMAPFLVVLVMGQFVFAAGCLFLIAVAFGPPYLLMQWLGADALTGWISLAWMLLVGFIVLIASDA